MARRTDPPPLFTCPVCGAESWNPHDAEHGYCGRCKDYTRRPSVTDQPRIPMPGDPPRGARLVFPDGSVTHLELVYESITDDGCYLWRATATWRLGVDQAQLHVDVIPPRTALSIECVPPLTPEERSA